MQAFVDFLLNITEGMGYYGVFLLMIVESSFIPFPSEVVIPPAAFLAAQGKMNLWLIIIFGTLGSWVGALINYYLALHLGRRVIYKLVDMEWSKWFLLDHHKLKKAEAYFLKHGALSTFVGRLIVGVRQLISLPAGFVKMNVVSFSIFTILGAGIWVSILAFLGYFYGAHQAAFNLYFFEIKWFLVAAMLTVLLLFFGRKLYLARKIKSVEEVG